MNNSTFIKGLVVCAALMIAFAGVLFLLNDGHSRPEGVAEDWLTAVGDTTREGVEADATRRADEIGPLELADRRLVSDDTDGKAAFADLEVGKAVPVSPDGPVRLPGAVKVAFQVHSRRGDDTVKVAGALTLVKRSGDWHVTASQLINDEHTKGDPANVVLAGVPELPSEGGPPPSSAPFGLWIGALVGAALIGAVTTSLVKVSGRDVAVAPA